MKQAEAAGAGTAEPAPLLLKQRKIQVEQHGNTTDQEADRMMKIDLHKKQGIQALRV